jgi:phosphinothricin acetyltransferase
MDTRIRPATEHDLDRINTIYNSYIVGKHTSFDREPWTISERRRWFERYETEGRYQVLVLEEEGLVLGFASSSPFKSKAAYETSVETTIVLDEVHLGRGLGRKLLSALLERLQAEPVHRAYALIALPNDPSVALHERLGYRHVGTLDEVGHKLDVYHSVLIMELALPG